MVKEVIYVKDLRKVFKAKIRESGLKNAIKAIFKPTYKEIPAVDGISFSVAEGELVAFIGPNGAGKSTTLKMLSGILYPNSGDIKILGLSPQKERKELAYKIGTVFGQKPQLWFHLPAADSFELFSKIYEMEDKKYRARIKELVKKFEIEDIVNQPVRKLSLGQRMRCEIVLSLVHSPKILFLDEPTIGLDVVVKKNIRELIKEINEKEKTTVILTSHDMGDIEKICKRVIIINHGVIIYDGKIQDLKAQYIKRRVVKALSETPIKFKAAPGVEIVKKTQFGLKLEVDTKKVKLKQVIDTVLKDNQIMDIKVEEPPIEELIESIYRKK